MRIKYFLLLICISITSVLVLSCNNTTEKNKDTQNEITGNTTSEISNKEETSDENQPESIEESPENNNTENEEPELAENTEKEEEFEPDPGYGKEIYNNTCASCHGISGAGDGVASAGLSPKPRDLSNSEYLSSLSDEHLFKTISEGGAAVGLSALMPPWKGILTDQQIRDVISHIRNNICKCNPDLKENSGE